MSAHAEARRTLLSARPRRWLVTGAAGFIGSHLVESLLELGQLVVGLDNFATGRPENLRAVEGRVGADAWRRFRMVSGDIRDFASCQSALEGVELVLHQAALSSVARSMEEPLLTHQTNVDGFVNLLLAAREIGVSRFVYASSSSVYGSSDAIPNREDTVGAPLSPYAVSKRCNELCADAYFRAFGLPVVGLRYFNVFGARQATGRYASVIPRWIAALVEGRPVQVNGRGDASRDFTYVRNIVQLNLLAALSDDPRVPNQVFNGAVAARRSLNELLAVLRRLLAPTFPHVLDVPVIHQPTNPHELTHSLADLEKAKSLLGYAPEFSLEDGLAESLPYYLAAH